MGVKIHIHSVAERLRPQESEVERLVADPAKAKKFLKWQAQHSGIEGLKTGLAKTLKWFQKPENLKFYEDNHYVI